MRSGEDEVDEARAGLREAQVVLKGLQQWLLQQERQRERQEAAGTQPRGEELAILRLLVEGARSSVDHGSERFHAHSENFPR
jgi:hypothetical protein